MFKIITIPFDRGKKGFDEELLNKFVLNKRINSFYAEFFTDGEGKYWTVFLDYDPVIESSSKNETDALDEGQRLLFERLKAWRKERGEKEGVPVYIIGTNKELVNIVKEAPKTLEALKNIKGFGMAKISKYGNEIIEIVKTFYNK